MSKEVGFQYIDVVYKYKEFISIIHGVYDHLSDNLSKNIFTNRLLYSLTDDPAFMRNVILATNEGKRLYDALCGKMPYIYGAGRRGERLMSVFSDIIWGGYIDRNQSGFLKGFKIIKPEDADRHIPIVISMYAGYNEVKEYLQSLGFEKEKLIALGEFDVNLTADIYLDKEILPETIDSDSFFIDAGAYDGKDTIRYGEFYGIGADNLHAVVYEPDSSNFANCNKNLESYKNVYLKKTGLGCEQGRAVFSDGKGEGSAILPDGSVTIQIERLDDMMSNEKVGFIKMDIEGAEHDALIGAEDIIRRQHPVLAISIYHKRNDIWEIPALILGMYPGYRLYLRHYTVSYGDTVLYAVATR